MKRTIITAAIILHSLVTGANGDSLPRIRDLPFEPVVYQAKSRIVIESQDEPTRYKLNVPSVPLRRDDLLCLRFEAYLEMPQPAGWNPFLSVVLNGEMLARYTRFAHSGSSTCFGRLALGGNGSRISDRRRRRQSDTLLCPAA